VTIIIGDASFLVKKLKGTGASPARVSNAGNEIEIEVNSDKPAAVDRKPRYVHQYSSQRRGGARVRMPVARTPATRGGMGRGSPATSTPGKLQESAKYNCPFCSQVFNESPDLYEHISVGHADQRDLIKKPKGREGMTIVPRPDEQEAEQEQEQEQPPVLIPVAIIPELASGEGEAEIPQVQEIYAEAVLDPVAAAQAIGKRKRSDEENEESTDGMPAKVLKGEEEAE
jgi:hypothetical protein